MRCAHFLVAVVCAAALPPGALADGVILNGISPRSLSRGGTNLGHFDNGGILHDNPAAMVNIAGEGLIDLGAVSLITDFNYADLDNNSVSDMSFTPLPQIAYIQTTPDGVWAYGIGLFTPAGFCETFDMQGPVPLVGERRYESFGALLKVLPGLSCRVTERLSVGGTFGLGISHAELEGPYFLQGPTLVGLPLMLDLQGTGATAVWSAGLQYRLSEATTIGATYISESDFTLRGNTRVDVPMFGATSYDSQLDVTWPQSVGVGVRHELCCHRAVSADVIWFNWSRAFDRFELRLRDPSNPMFPELVEHFPLAWRDTVSVRLGYEQQMGPGTLRTGYVYHRSPVPDATLTPFIQATLEHAVSVGYSWCCGGGWELDLGYMVLFGPERTVAASQFVGGDFDNSRHSAAIHAVLLGLMKQF